MAYIGDDPYDYPYQPRRRSPRAYPDEYRRSAQYLDPRANGGLQRTRSTGNERAPNIYIYNDQVQDAQQRAASPGYPPPQYPPAPAAPPQMMPGQYPMQQPQTIPIPVPYPYPAAAYPASPERRGRGRLGDDLLEEMAYMDLRDRARSRSRGRSDVGRERPDFYEYDLERKARELDEERKKMVMEKEYELRKMRDEDKRRRADDSTDAERKRVIQEYEDKKRKDAAAAKEAEIRYQEKMAREKREEREEEDRLKEKFRRDEELRQEKEKKEYEAFLQKQKDKAEKEKAEAKQQKEKFEREMRKRLEEFGVYSQAQIDYMVDEEKAKKAKEERSRSRTRVTVTDEMEVWRPSRPVYPKVHRDYIEIETLTYYNIPYTIDPADTNYIIIRREMDKYETDVLFEHTRRIRSGDRTLLIEAPKKDKNYAWYRKRDRSTSRVRKVGILETRRVI
ncbi:hypothetical protein LTR10_004138 [Elasticomyces elasticus]|nr:hypothetical protein LTR10_004138 [Elasticomyces elasticus]KAK4977678.1 hypothetical protein LTR42_002049 [Elasticomyces elasticus]